MKSNRRRLAVGVVVLFLLGFAYSYLEPNIIKPLFFNDTDQQDDYIYLKEIDTFLGCRHSACREEKLISSQFQKRLKKLGIEWRLEAIGDGEMVLTQNKQGICSECQASEFLGVYLNNIAIYHGKPERPGPVKAVTPIKISGLLEKEINDLKKGVFYQDEEEKLAILEGYSELGNKKDTLQISQDRD